MEPRGSSRPTDRLMELTPQKEGGVRDCQAVQAERNSPYDNPSLGRVNRQEWLLICGSGCCFLVAFRPFAIGTDAQ